MSEAKKNAVAILIAGGIAVLVGFFLLRPATVLGTNGDSLRASLAGFDRGSWCREIPGDRWRCFIFYGSESNKFVVETRAFGCWDAWLGRDMPTPGEAPNRSGCISVLDVL